MGKPCGSPFVPFGALSGAACKGESFESGAECDVACYAGFVSGGGKATCTDGTLAFSGCTPEPSHRTIVLKGAGAPDSERGLNGTFEAVAPYTTPLKWKSTSTPGAVIEARRTESDKLDIYMGGDFKGAIEITHAGGTTTMRVVDVYPGASASFGKDATLTKDATEQPVAAGCADLRACLALTPLDLAACASAAAGSASCATKNLVAAGSRLDHEGTKVDLYTLESALLGSDARGVFVVLPAASTAKSQSGKMLFVAAGATKGALFDVLFDEPTKVWRAKKTNWVLIVGLIGGGVVLLVILIISLAYAFRAPHPYTMMM